MTHFTDSLIVDGDGLKQTADGWVVDARVARGGNVQTYLGSEVGRQDMDYVRVYRPEDQVFSRDAINSYARKPVTIDHPPGGVNPENWSDLAVGDIDSEVVRDGEYVRVPLLLRDKKAADAVTGGKRELSMGYDAKLEFSDGVTPNGDEYDAVMSDFRMNHVALVSAARGGSELRIGDGAGNWGASPITDANHEENNMTTRKIVVDGLSVETTDAGAQAIEKLQGQLRDANSEHAKALATKDSEHETVVAAKDKELATKDARIEELEAKVVSDEDLDKRVADRAKLVGDAKRLAPDLDTKGLKDADIRKAVLTKKLGDEKVKTMSDAYVDARFDIELEKLGDEQSTDPIADSIGDFTSIGDSDIQKERQAMLDEMKGIKPSTTQEA